MSRELLIAPRDRMQQLGRELHVGVDDVRADAVSVALGHVEEGIKALNLAWRHG